MPKHSSPIVVIDTREQQPYLFPSDWVTVQKALPSGDYSILGHEDCFAIERKSLSDLLGCILQERFRKELERLQSFKHAFLVVEANLWKIRKGNHFSKVRPESVIGLLQSFPLRYGVHVLFLDDRATANNYVMGLLEKYHRYLLKEKE